MLPVFPAAAQSFTAQISGRLVDESGAVLPGVTITAINEETGERRTVTTADGGAYLLTNLGPGRYTVTAELQGFATVSHKGIELTVNQAARLDLQMPLARLTETVQVSSDAPLVDTTNSEVALTVNRQQIENLPLNGRNFLELALLAPGVKVPLERTSTDISFGAAGGRSSNVQVDGADNNDDTVGGSESSFSMDSVREFQVVTNRFSAEFGRSSGGLVNVVTKSGTNELQGSGFGYFRDDTLKAANWFTGNVEPFSRKQYGVSVGGPIVQNRAHFFVTLERQTDDETGVSNTGASYLDVPVPVTSRTTMVFTKLDQQLGERHRLFASYAGTYSNGINSGVGGSSTIEWATNRDRTTHAATLGNTTIVSQRAVNDFRFLYRNHDTRGEPNVSRPALMFPSANLGARTNYPQSRIERRLQFRDDFGYFVPDWGGTHAFKVGVDVSRVEYTAFFANFTNGAFTFAKDPADFTDPSTYPAPTRYQQGLGKFDVAGSTHVFNGYAQDDWQPANRLTLNLGVRYEVELGAANNDFETKRSDLVARKKTDVNNVAPRFGVAYNVFGNGRTVVRGGSGLFYDQFLLNMSLSEKLFNGETFVIADLKSPPPISLTAPLGGRGFEDFLAASGATSVQRLDPNIAVPYAYQSSVGLQQQIGDSVAFAVDYVRVDGRNEIVRRDANLDPACPNIRAGCARPYPKFAAITESASIGDSVYNGMHLSFTIRRPRYSVQTAYTLSKAMNVSDDPAIGSQLSDQFDADADWGPAASDRRHTLVVNGSYDLPYGFQVSGIFNGGSGFVILGTRVSQDLNGDGVINDRPDGVSRNGYRSNPTAKVDARVTKSVKIGRVGLMGVLEVFNVFNRENYDPGAYGNRIGTTQFLRPGSSTLTYFQPREVQLALRVSF